MSIKVCKVNYLFIVYFIYIPSTLLGVSVPFIYNTTDRNCSWEFENVDSGYQKETQQCEVLLSDTTGNNGGVCENPIRNPDLAIDRAVPVDDMKIEEITRYLTFAGSTDMDGNHTCVRITYTIDRGVTEKISGIQFRLYGKSTPDLAKQFCQNHVYGINGDGLEYYSVVHARTCTPRECELRMFVYDQFCGIVPGLPYVVGVRTLPVDFTHKQEYDTIEILRYPDNLTNSGSNCTAKPNDMRCRLNDEAKWTSNFVEVLSNNSWNIPDSVNVTLKFALAPKDLRFDRYKVLLYKTAKTSEGDCEGGRPNVFTNVGWIARIDRHDGSDITHEFKNVDTSSCYQFMIIPEPITSCKMGIDKRDYNCSYTYSDIFNPTANPCSTNPCGENGLCTSPTGKEYTCTCNVGFESYNGTCLRNPCLNDTGNQNKDLCGEFSRCNVTFAGKNGHLEYQCVCDDPGYYLNVVNNTCILLTQTSGINPRDDTGAIIAGVIGGVLLLIALIILGLYKKRNSGRTIGTDQQPPAAVLDHVDGNLDVPPHFFDQANRHSGTGETESQFSEHFKSVNEDPPIIPMDAVA